MESAHVRIFPHSQDEFRSEDNLRTWLLTGLRGRGGVYHLRGAHPVKELPAGSVVLFRYGNRIVGEAVVVKEWETLLKPLEERTLTGEEVLYESQVTFSPSSVRLYAPPVPVEQLRLDKDIVTSGRQYPRLDWGDYALVLREVVSQGTFVT